MDCEMRSIEKELIFSRDCHKLSELLILPHFILGEKDGKKN